MKDNKKIYIGLFIFLLIIMFLSPISGDDWGNYLEGSLGLKHMIGQAIGMYFTWEGRFISRLLINLLTYNKWLWNIINSILVTSIVYLINRICKFKNKTIMILLTISIIIYLNLYTFSQVIVWIAGNITYLFVIPLILLYFYMMYYKKETKKDLVILILLNIVIPMFIEHMAIILIIINIYFLVIDYLKTKKINKKILLFLIISICSFLLMFLSPGNRIRSSMENLEFNKLNIIEKILYNIPNFILYTYLVNYFLIGLIIIGSILLIKNTINNKNIRICLYIFELISLVFEINYLLITFNITSNSINENNIFLTIYYLLLTIINFILLIKNSKNTKKDLSIIFFCLGILSNLVMLISPTWGYRTSFSTYLFLSISYLIIIDKYINNKEIIRNSLVILNTLGILFYIVFYININRVYKDNKVIIEQAKKNNSSTIEIISYPGFAPCNINPNNEYHLSKFKRYYKINENTEIKFINDKWKYLIIYKK